MKIPVLVGITAALLCVVDAAIAGTPAEIQTLAKAVTVKIKLTEAQEVGSGTIVYKQGNLYTLITNRHVVCPERAFGKDSKCTAPSPTETFQLTLGNNTTLKVRATAVKVLSQDLDLAAIQFRSDRHFPIAKVAPPGSLKVGDRVYTSGYPAAAQGFSVNTGYAIAVVNKRLTEDRGGYTVLYNAGTQPGMSGGAVFDPNGRIVAIHGQGERYKENTQLPIGSEVGISYFSVKVGSKIGLNRGIPVRWVVHSLVGQGIKLGGRDPVVPAPAAVSNTADEYFIAGFNKLIEPGNDFRAGKQQAIQKFSQAIHRNPHPSYAPFLHFVRAITYEQLQDYRSALTDYNRAIELNPHNESGYLLRGNLKAQKLNDAPGAIADYDRAISLAPEAIGGYINRGALKAQKLNDNPGALADFNRAIALAPKASGGYIGRGALAAYKLNDNSAALADFDRAISLSPQDDLGYIFRGILKYDRLDDAQGALADFNQAIALNPKNELGYYVGIGLLKAYKLNDTPGALVEFNKAIALDPSFALAYYSRGLLKADKLNDLQGALADYNRAIALNPNYADSYYNRGLLKADKLEDPQGALADYSQAIAIDPQSDKSHTKRGDLKQFKLKDLQGALADYSRAIAIAPNDPQAYGARGFLKYTELKDRTGGIADVQTAARLAKVQGNELVLNLALQTLQAWGAK